MLFMKYFLFKKYTHYLLMYSHFTRDMIETWHETEQGGYRKTLIDVDSFFGL